MRLGRVVVWVALVAVGCGADEDQALAPEPVTVLDPSALVPVDADRDPLADHRPANVDCSPATWGPEGGGFEVQTGACNYASFDQPLSSPIEAGDALAITIWHDFLDAAEPATAHVAVWVDSTVLWETEVDIPAASASIDAVVPIETTLPAGARLGLHLHNHGFNSWRFISVERRPR